MKEGALNVVMGVNDHLYRPDKHHLLTAASCTTNCLAPVVKVIHEGIGIRHGVITTIHDITNTQIVVDAPHKDLRRARASSLSLIPTTHRLGDRDRAHLPRAEGQAERHRRARAAPQRVAHRLRVRGRAADDGRGGQRAPQGGGGRARSKGILGYEERPLVSVDFKDDPRSAIVDALSTMVVDGTCVKILAWYDNEIGYVHRMMELARKVGQSLR